MKALFQKIKENIIPGILFYAIPFVLIVIKVQYYDMGKLNRLLAVTGLRNNIHLTEFIAKILFTIFLLLIGIAYQRYIVKNERILKTLSYTLIKGPKLILLTIPYVLLLSFVASAINMSVLPIAMLTNAGSIYLAFQYVILVILGSTILVSIVARMADNKKYINPLSVMMEIKQEYFFSLTIISVAYFVGILIISIAFNYLISVRFTVVRQNYIAIFSNALTFLMLIAVQNFSVMYYNNLTEEVYPDKAALRKK